MKVLVTGTRGQLARALQATVPAGVELAAVDRSTLDLANIEQIAKVIEAYRPAVLINAAAYTAVDVAESDRDAAFAVNANAVGAMAKGCRAVGARLVHVSTDFVFDGTKGSPYKTDDATNPLSVYGASKLDGERQIAAVAGLQWSIIRTAWVYAAQGRNFVNTMLRLFREREVVNVVSDQVGTPTSAISLARCVWSAATDSNNEPAILHYTDAGVASWYDFAVAIYEEGHALGLLSKPVSIVPIGTDQYPTPAKRPSYSVLDKRTTLARLNVPFRHWRVSLREAMREIAA